MRSGLVGWEPSFAERLKKLWRAPEYRTKVAFFVLLGLLAGLLAGRLEEDPRFWSDALKQFSIVFIAVGLLQLLWDFLGGDPLSLEIRSVDRRMSLLSDLLDQRLGVERVWAIRREWERDIEDGLDVWQGRVCQAKHVDIMSNTFWNNWLKEEEFVARFCHALERPGTRVRILVYDPASSVARLRAKDEEAKEPKTSLARPTGNHGEERAGTSEMTSEIERTIGRVEGIYQERSMPRRRLELRLSAEYPQLAQIVRADDCMLVALYLSGRTGGHSPTLQLTGPSSRFFDAYQQQFEVMWERATPFPSQRIGREGGS